MDGFHVLRKKRYIDDFEIFIMVLSALEWKKHNGSIKLVTDRQGLQFVQHHGLFHIWDTVDCVLDDIDGMPVNEHVFWAGSKIVALSRQKAPCAMIDLDFIVWKPINFSAYGEALAVIHREQIMDSIYPSQEFFKMQDYKWNENWNWSVCPCNTAFVYFGNEELRRQYCSESIRFMCHADVKEDYLRYMVFAEQRLLAICADMLKCPIYSFAQLVDLFDNQQTCFTHLWGEKELLRQDRQYAERFCRQCALRIMREFPQWARWLQQFDWFKQYAKGLI